MYNEAMRNLTITNDILPLSSSEETDILPWLKALAFVIMKRQPFLNVSRGNGSLYAFLLCAKNAFVCYGISYKLPKLLTIQVMVLLFQSSMLSSVTSDYLDLTLLLLYLSLGVNSLPDTVRFLIYLGSLTVLPIFYHTHYSTEYFVDFFCVVNLTWYILDDLLRLFSHDLEKLFSIMIAYSILLLTDVTVGTGGYLFDLVLLFHMSMYLCHCFREHTVVNLVFSSTVIGIFVFCAHEKIHKLNINTLSELGRNIG